MTSLTMRDLSREHWCSCLESWFQVMTVSMVIRKTWTGDEALLGMLKYILVEQSAASLVAD